MPDKEEQCVPGAQRHAGHRERLTKSWGEGEGWPEGHVPENRWFGPEVFFSLPSGGVWGEGEGDSLRVWGPGRSGWQAGAGDQGGALGGQSLTAARYHTQQRPAASPLPPRPHRCGWPGGGGCPPGFPGHPRRGLCLKPASLLRTTWKVESRSGSQAGQVPAITATTKLPLPLGRQLEGSCGQQWASARVPSALGLQSLQIKCLRAVSSRSRATARPNCQQAGLAPPSPEFPCSQSALDFAP